MVRVLIAEDSVTAAELLSHVLASDPDIDVIGVAKNGLEAVRLVSELKPDLVTMDIHMPRLDGVEATRRIMVERPTPIVIVSLEVDSEQASAALNALGAGALALQPKLPDPGSDAFDASAARLLSTVKAMASVKVVRRWEARPKVPEAPPAAPPAAPGPARERASVVGVAASTGGPPALFQLLAELPRDFPAPLLVVQHISPGFEESLASWLDGAGPLRVKLAEPGEEARPGHVYVAPRDRHLAITATGRVRLSDAPPVRGFRPSASVLFSALAEAAPDSALGVILTGMGEDGVDGLCRLSRAGGRVIAQDQASSVVWGMPGAAVAAGVTDLVLPLSAIAPKLIALTRHERTRNDRT